MFLPYSIEGLYYLLPHLPERTSYWSDELVHLLSTLPHPSTWSRGQGCPQTKVTKAGDPSKGAPFRALHARNRPFTLNPSSSPQVAGHSPSRADASVAYLGSRSIYHSDISWLPEIETSRNSHLSNITYIPCHFLKRSSERKRESCANFLPSR